MSRRKASSPPTDADRIALFLDSVQRYEEMADAFPLPETINLGPVSDPRDYWLHVMHGALLRKYVAPGDALYLRRVIDAFERSVDCSDPAVAGTWVELRRAFNLLPGRGGIEFVVNDVRVTSHALAFDDLYGTLLHGDFDRWKRSRRGAMVNGLGLFDWVLGTRGFVILVRDHWRLAERDGLIRVTLPT